MTLGTVGARVGALVAGSRFGEPFDESDSSAIGTRRPADVQHSLGLGLMDGVLR